MKIYLSGPIYKDDKQWTEQWRRQAAIYLEEYEIQVIDPCRRKAVYDAAVFTPKEITARDHMDVSKADLVLLYGIFKPEHLGIGTWCEMQLAHDLKIPIVVVTDDPRIQAHPWVQDYQSKTFEGLYPALEYIVDFWKE
jgi:nucleoside 2-deoxyribosyltransferase